MSLVAPPDSVSVEKVRPRPFGSGRLFAWRVELAVPLATVVNSRAGQTKAAIVSEGLDPVTSQLDDARWRMGFGQIASFTIDFSARKVRLVEAHPETDQATIDHLLDDHVAPRVLAADGTLVLHGSATLVGSHIAAFLGLTGSGKSTLSASLHAAGYPLLGDDAVAISEAGCAIMGEAVYPSLRLYRESIEQVFAESLPTSAMAFYSDKRHVGVPNLADGASTPSPLGAVFVLAQGDSGVSLYRLSPAEACMAFLENSFALDPKDGAIAARRMAAAARMAAAIPCYELAYPYDFSLLPQVREQVIGALSLLPAAA